uniref:hypothetical protein n=1 Tax=Sabulicella rubraurantiaca TaxID=2811429 RepID=UPI001A966357|nr:hypothetical protein [Sabulicella rubraurantiaca]
MGKPSSCVGGRRHGEARHLRDHAAHAERNSRCLVARGPGLELGGLDLRTQPGLVPGAGQADDAVAEGGGGGRKQIRYHAAAAGGGEEKARLLCRHAIGMQVQHDAGAPEQPSKLRA